MTGIQLVTSDELTTAVGAAVTDAIPSDIAGATVLHKFAFTHALAGLVEGATFWTPRVGEVILGWSIVVTEVWDGTNPTLDLGSFQGSNSGWFNYQNGVVDLTVYTAPDQAGTGITFASTNDSWNFPAVFTTTDPIKIVVTQNGQLGGDDPVSTQGHATLYWATAMPLAVAG